MNKLDHNNPYWLSDFIIKHGVQKAPKAFREYAVKVGMLVITYDRLAHTLGAMCSCAYRYGRKKAIAARKEKA